MRDERFLLFVQTAYVHAYAYISLDLWAIRLPHIFLHYSSNVRAAEEPTYDDDIVSTRQNFLNNILRLPSWNLEEERPFSSAANISDIYELELLVWLGMTW